MENLNVEFNVKEKTIQELKNVGMNIENDRW